LVPSARLSSNRNQSGRARAARLKTVHFDYEKGVAKEVTALPRLKLCIRRRNHAADGAESMPVGEQTSELSHAEKCRAGNLKWQGMPPGIPPEMAVEFIAKLKAGSTVRKLTAGWEIGPSFREL